MNEDLNITVAQANALSQFIGAIAKEAYKEAYREIETMMAKKEPKMYTRKEVAALLNISLPTVHELVNDGVLIPHYVGRKPLFKAQEIDDAISTGELRKYKRRSKSRK